MNNPQQINVYKQSPKEVYFPLEELVSLLLQQGFQVKPDDYLEMLKVLAHADTADIAQLKYQLCPLVATNKEEQLLFYTIFDKYVGQITVEKNTTTPVRKILLKRYWLPLLCILVILLLPAIYYYQLPRYKAVFNILVNQEEREGKTFAIIGDTIHLDATPVFTGKKIDTTNTKISWNTGKGWDHENQLKLNFINTTPGEYLIRLKVESGLFNRQVTIDSQYIHSSKRVLDFVKVDKKEPLYPGDSIVMEPVFRGEDQLPEKSHWIVNTDTLLYTGNRLVQHFDSTGGYIIEYACTAGDGNTMCNQHVVSIYNVQKPKSRVTMDVLSDGPAIPPEPYFVSAWITIVIALIALGANLLSFWLYQRNNNKKKEIEKNDEERVNPYIPPYEVPLENKELQKVTRENSMNALFTTMRRKIEDDTHVLNVSATIHQIIRSGGIPSLVFTNRLKQRVYLILIDRANAKSQQMRLFEYLVRLLDQEDICIERFYYTTFNDFYNNEYPSGISLQKLSELYKSSTVLIFGNAQQLMHHVYPAIEKEKLRMLGEWEYKAILTPEAYKDWGIREEVLKERFILLPADIKGQLQLMQAIRENQLKQDKYLSGLQKGYNYEVDSWSFSDIDEIQEYLDDELLFQWLCAICVYPKLRWEIIIGIGEAILSAAGEPRKLNFTNLLKLVRIKWMQEGTFPENTRLELLKKLTVSNELIAREAVLSMLEYSDPQTQAESYFEEEKKLQQLTNKFVVFANTRKKAYQESYDSFKQLWQENNILDGPLKRYLNKKEGDNWDTPILQDNKNVGIDEFFKTETKLANIASRRENRKYYYLPVILLLACTLFLIFQHQLLNTDWGRKLKLVTVDKNAIHNLTFQLKTNDTCEHTLYKMVLSLNNRKYNMQLSENMSAVGVPYEDLSKPGTIEMMTANDTLIAQKEILFTSSNNIILINGLCKSSPIANSAKRVINIFFNDPAMAADVERIKSALLNKYNRYTINASLQTLKDSSILRYYSSDDRQLAISVASLAENILGKRFSVELSRPNFDSNIVINFALLNDTAIACRNYSPASLPKSLAEIWHGGTSNRLISIDISQGLIFYSVNDEKSYGTYKMDEICLKNNIYKIITRSDKGYKLFFIKNIKEDSFELSVCQNFNQTKAELIQKDESYCDRFNLMTKYYSQNNNDTIVYLPAYKSTNLSPTEQLKLQKMLRGYSDDRSMKLKIFIVGNHEFIGDERVAYTPVTGISSAAFMSIIKNLNLNIDIYDDIDYSVDASATPFQRSTMRLAIQKGIPIEAGLTDAADSKELGTIIIDEWGTPDSESRTLISTTAADLRIYTSRRIILEGTYTTIEEKRKIEAYINTISNLFYKSGVVKNLQQIDEKIVESTGTVNQQRPAYQMIRVTGINFSDNTRVKRQTETQGKKKKRTGKLN